MSIALENFPRLKPEIRLAQAVSQFEGVLSNEQKTTFRAYRSRLLYSSPDPSDVMRLTAEIDHLASGKVGGRCFGPRFTNFLQAVQQFAALGDVVGGGAQNIIACGVWSLVRMSLLVSVLASLTIFSTNAYIVDPKLLLSRKVVDSLHERRPFSTTLPKHGSIVPSIQKPAISRFRILYCGSPSLRTTCEVYTEVDLSASDIFSKRLEDKGISIGARSVGGFN